MANTKVDIKYFSDLNVDSFGGGFAAGFVRNLHTPLDMGSVQPFLSYFTDDLSGLGTTNNLYKGQIIAVTNDDNTANSMRSSVYAPHDDLGHKTGLWYVYGYSHSGAASDPGTYYADRILTKREVEQLFENRSGSYYAGVGEWWQLTRSTYTDDKSLVQRYVDGTMTDADKARLKFAEIFNDYEHNVAYAQYSSASGQYTRSGNTNEFSIGQYNVTSTAYSGSLFNVGVGTSDAARSNALTIFKNGAAVLSGNTYLLSQLTVAKETVLQAQTDIYGPTYAHNNIFIDSGVSGGGQPWNTGSERYIKFTGQSDAAYIRFYCVGDGSDNSGDVNELEISTFDNNEPIRVRQYGVKGDNPTYPLANELTLLDRNGNTYIPNNTYVGKNLSVGQASISTGYTFYVNGSANVTGRTTLNEKLTVADDTVLQNKLSVGQPAISTYTFHVQGSANVSGATTLNSTLTVKDNSVHQSHLTVGQTAVNTTYMLHVNGTSNLVGNTTITGTVIASGQAVMQDKLTVGQATASTYTFHVQGSANVSGATTLNDALTVKGNSVHQANLTVGQTAVNTSYTLYVNGKANVTGQTTLNDTLAVSGATTLYSSLTTAGQVIMQDKLTVGQATASSYTLHVAGTHNVTGQTTLNDTLTVAKESILQSRLTVGQAAVNTTYTAHINGTTNIVGATTITGAVTASGDTVLQAKLSVGQNAISTYTFHTQGTANVSGATTLNSTLTVKEDSVHQAKLTVGQTAISTYTFHVQGTANVSGATTLNNTLTVSGNSVHQSCLTVGQIAVNSTYTLHVNGSANVTGATTLNSTLVTKGKGTMQDDLDVVGKLTVQGASGNDGVLRVYSINNTTNASYGKEIMGIQSILDGRDPESGEIIADRCIIALQPRGGRVAIGKTLPEYTLDVTGNARLTSTLRVEGDTTLFGNTFHYSNVTLTHPNISTESATTQRYVQLYCANNDWGMIRVGGTASDSGWVEIASGDNGNEPVYARQYSSTTVTNEVMLLDPSGNTSFPHNVTAGGTINAPTLNITGNATIGGNLSVIGDVSLKLWPATSTILGGICTGYQNANDNYAVALDGSGYYRAYVHVPIEDTKKELKEWVEDYIDNKIIDQSWVFNYSDSATDKTNSGTIANVGANTATYTIYSYRKDVYMIGKTEYVRLAVTTDEPTGWITKNISNAGSGTTTGYTTYFTVAENWDPSVRTATVTFTQADTAKKVYLRSISQAAAKIDYYLTYTGTTSNLDQNGASTTLTVTSTKVTNERHTENIDWSINNPSAISWATISKSGNTISITAAENTTTSARSGSFTISNAGTTTTITISQKAGVEAYVLDVASSVNASAPTGGTVSFSVTSYRTMNGKTTGATDYSVSAGGGATNASKGGSATDITRTVSATVPHNESFAAVSTHYVDITQTPSNGKSARVYITVPGYPKPTAVSYWLAWKFNGTYYPATGTSTSPIMVQCGVNDNGYDLAGSAYINCSYADGSTVKLPLPNYAGQVSSSDVYDSTYYHMGLNYNTSGSGDYSNDTGGYYNYNTSTFNITGHICFINRDKMTNGYRKRSAGLTLYEGSSESSARYKIKAYFNQPEKKEVTGTSYTISTSGSWSINAAPNQSTTITVISYKKTDYTTGDVDYTREAISTPSQSNSGWVTVGTATATGSGTSTGYQYTLSASANTGSARSTTITFTMSSQSSKSATYTVSQSADAVSSSSYTLQTPDGKTVIDISAGSAAGSSNYTIYSYKTSNWVSGRTTYDRADIQRASNSASSWITLDGKSATGSDATLGYSVTIGYGANSGVARGGSMEITQTGSTHSITVNVSQSAGGGIQSHDYVLTFSDGTTSKSWTSIAYGGETSSTYTIYSYDKQTKYDGSVEYVRQVSGPTTTLTWVSIVDKTDAGSGTSTGYTFKVKADANSSTSTRFGSITFTNSTKSLTISVNQAAAPDPNEVVSTEYYIKFASGNETSQTVPAFANTAVSHDIDIVAYAKITKRDGSVTYDQALTSTNCSDTWFSINTTRTATGSGTSTGYRLKLDVTANSGSARSGTVTLTNPHRSITLSISQQAGSVPDPGSKMIISIGDQKNWEETKKVYALGERKEIIIQSYYADTFTPIDFNITFTNANIVRVERLGSDYVNNDNEHCTHKIVFDFGENVLAFNREVRLDLIQQEENAHVFTVSLTQGYGVVNIKHGNTDNTYGKMMWTSDTNNPVNALGEYYVQYESYCALTERPISIEKAELNFGTMWDDKFAEVTSLTNDRAYLNVDSNFTSDDRNVKITLQQNGTHIRSTFTIYQEKFPGITTFKSKWDDPWDAMIIYPLPLGYEIESYAQYNGRKYFLPVEAGVPSSRGLHCSVDNVTHADECVAVFRAEIIDVTQVDTRYPDEVWIEQKYTSAGAFFEMSYEDFIPKAGTYFDVNSTTNAVDENTRFIDVPYEGGSGTFYVRPWKADGVSLAKNWLPYTVSVSPATRYDLTMTNSDGFGNISFTATPPDLTTKLDGDKYGTMVVSVTGVSGTPPSMSIRFDRMKRQQPDWMKDSYASGIVTLINNKDQSAPNGGSISSNGSGFDITGTINIVSNTPSDYAVYKIETYESGTLYTITEVGKNIRNIMFSGYIPYARSDKSYMIEIGVGRRAIWDSMTSGDKSWNQINDKLEQSGLYYKTLWQAEWTIN